MPNTLESIRKNLESINDRLKAENAELLNNPNLTPDEIERLTGKGGDCNPVDSIQQAIDELDGITDK